MALPSSARADGAFPDSQIILTPADPAQEIILVTNFGLIQSEDAGATWLWACEQTANGYGVFYQLSPPPRHRLYVLANQQVLFSDDRSCGWTAAAGLSTGPGDGPSDFWVDRATPDRVLAVNLTTTGGAVTHTLLESTDGGVGFGKMLYQADPGAMITGVESAASDPRTIYLTLLGAPKDGGRPPPMLARTSDGGISWQVVDLKDQLGDGVLGLVAIDPVDPDKVFLLWRGVDGQALVLTPDGGVTARAILTPSGVMKAFLRLADGAILVSTDDQNTAGLFRSRDGGTTFDTLPNPPHVRALSQRGDTIYAATDNFAEGYAVGLSKDDGSTWSSLLAYEDVQAVVPCLKAACRATCEAQVQLTLWSEDVCTADAPMSSAGSGGQGAGGMGSGGQAAGGTAGAHGSAPGPAAGRESGCRCQAGDDPLRRRPGASVLVLVCSLALLVRRRGRDRQKAT